MVAIGYDNIAETILLVHWSQFKLVKIRLVVLGDSCRGHYGKRHDKICNDPGRQFDTWESHLFLESLSS